MITILKALLEKVDNMQDQIGNFSRGMESIRESNVLQEKKE